MINAKTKICCIIGNPVEHSLSPQMHNAAYQSLGLNYVFVAFPVVNVEAAVAGIREFNFRGVAVTIPHKMKIMKYLDETDETAQKIGAVNTIVNDNGILKGINTDWIGAIKALEEKIKLEGKKVALFGAGGAARAIAYGLKTKKAKVYVYNRTKRKADVLKDEFKLDGSYSLHTTGKIKEVDIIINTTSAGMEPNDWDCPIPGDFIQKHQVVFDIIYKPRNTQLLKFAKDRGAEVVYGYKMLLYQGIEQFKLFAGMDAPVKVMEEVLLKEL